MSCSCLLAFLFYSGRQLCSLLYSQLLFLSYFIWATWGFLFCINTGIRNESRMNQGSLSATADLLLILATFTVSLAYFSVCFYCFFMQKCKNILHVWNLTETETLPLQLPVFGREHENKHIHTCSWWVYFLSGLLSSSLYPYFIGIILLWWPGQRLRLIWGPWKHGEWVYKDSMKVETPGVGENAKESSENFSPLKADTL